MLFIRLARGGGVVQVLDAESARVEDEELVCRAADGHVVCRFERLDVLAFSPNRDIVEDGEATTEPPTP